VASGASRTGGRVWRVRRRQRHIDAEIHDTELVLRYGGRLIYARRWPSREAAEADARAKLEELERAGWITHW
jgi:hypothetical protein